MLISRKEARGWTRCVLPGVDCRKGGRSMKKEPEKKVLEKEAVLWSKMKSTLDRDDIRMCKK